MKVLSIGAGVEQLESIKLAKTLNLEVVACDKNKYAEGFKYATHTHHIDIKNEKEIIALAKKHDVRFVLPSPIGRYLTTVGAVNDALSLKGISKQTASMCTDKYLFYQALNKEVNLAKQFLVKNQDEVKTHIDKKDIQTPFILKPRFGSGSTGVKVFDIFNQTEIDNYFSKNNSLGDILLEELLSGDEIGVDAIIRDGNLEIIAIRDKKMTPLPYRQEISYTLPSRYKNKTTEILSILKKICKILSIGNSLINTDIIINEQSIYIIELSARASGNNISSVLLPKALNINPLSIMINFLIGKTQTLTKKTIPTHFEFFNFDDSVIGKKIKDITIENNINNLNTYNIKLKKDDIIKSIKSGKDALINGYFILSGENMNIRESKKKVYNTIEIETNINEMNKIAWSKEINKNIMLYPDTYIISFLARNYPSKESNKDLKALDIGFGSGRNLKLLLDYNFQTYGIDYSEDACTAAEKTFALTQNQISCEDLTSNPFKGKQFDVILAYGVMFLKPIIEMKKDFKILKNNLTINGKMLINFRTKDDFLYKSGKKLNEDTYILDHPSYQDMCYTFLDLDEVKGLLIDSGFEIQNISKVDYHKNNLTEHHSWWIAEVIKLEL